ncbi:LysR family transcriptional regulator [Variovorax dokdonensis]|uniref:LysR family transcriptional regulator n=1 Tax=Variovorax dokdonensis TaxID=344883 RepID=A0ABT7NFI7_9BURK|nr:LysR family transcriptional regulator [Variovorax dokdonensis]MDM0046706.1 LysR family transcriptional regulator [Variovorax dokdonensis]
MRQINLDQLQTLITISDLGSFSAAAQALHLAQPTVSLHVSELEARLGVPLMHRGARRVHPTAAGAELVERGRRLLRDVDDAVDASRRLHAGLEGRVRLGVSTTGIVVDVLPPAFELLAQRYPGIEVSPRFIGSDASAAGLLAGTVDVALVSLPQPSLPGVRFAPWMRHEMHALVPASWRSPKRATAAWLAAQPLIMNEPFTRMYALTMEWFGKAGFSPRPRLEHNYDVAMRGLVEAGYGAALLPLRKGDEAQIDPRVRVLPLSPRLTRQLVIGYRADEAKGGAVARVVEVLMDQAKPQ